MENQSTRSIFLPKLYCSIFGHNYKVSKKVTEHVKEYTCTCCKKQLTTSSDGNLVELTPKFKEINAILEHIYEAKTQRSKRKYTFRRFTNSLLTFYNSFLINSQLS